MLGVLMTIGTSQAINSSRPHGTALAGSHKQLCGAASLTEKRRPAASRYYLKHHDKILVKNRIRGQAYRLTHKEQIRAYTASRKDKRRAWRLNHNATHQDKIRSYRRVKYAATRRESQVRNRAYYIEHHAEELAKRKAWRETHRAEVAEQSRQYRLTHPAERLANHHRRKARKLGNGGSYTAEEWLAACASWGGKCLCCGAARELTVDHVVPLARGGRNDIGNLQLLCQACNRRKGTQTIDYRPGNTQSRQTELWAVRV